MKRVFQRPYVYWALGVFLLYLTLAVVLSGFYTTVKLIILYANTVNWFKLSLSLLFSLTIGALVATNTVYLFILSQARRHCGSSKTLTSVGTATGLLTGICPLCVTGLIPLLFGFFGVSFTLGSLPFQGLEIQALTIVLLGFSLFLLRRR